ncbi:MAG: GGDEF domain-containing protein [Clostridiales bacterium]|nr:GGDEF domain-containing protein [Clostridiales bacterium]
MSILLRKIKSVEFTPELMQYVHKLNIIRISFASAVVVLFQIFSVGFAQDKPTHITASLTISIIGIAYFIGSIILSKGSIQKIKNSRLFQMSFWIVMLFAMIPYFARDIAFAVESGYVKPINLTLYTIAVITFPVFTIAKLSTIFTLVFIVNISIALTRNAPLGFYVDTVLVSVVGLVTAIIFQYQNLLTICKLQLEIRIDGLTGILNRRAGIEKLETTFELCKRSLEPIAVFMVDVDFFKHYNDTFGHIKGDMALKNVSSAIKSVFARSTDMICRYDGEEFLISAACTEEEASKSAKMLLSTILGMQMKVPGNPISDVLTVSIGYTVYEPVKNHYNADISAIIDKADAAMYEAKNSGRSKIVSLPLNEGA